jgi:hypothetical protein
VHPQGDLRLSAITAERSLADQDADHETALELAEVSHGASP